MILLWCFAIFGVLIMSYYFWELYTTIEAEIIGNSMLPTLTEGDRVLCRRLVRRSLNRNVKVGVGDIVLVRGEPYGVDHILIKRIKEIYCSCGEVWIEGDNPDESRDSREFGWVCEQDIIAVVNYKSIKGSV